MAFFSIKFFQPRPGVRQPQPISFVTALQKTFRVVIFYVDSKLSFDHRSCDRNPAPIWTTCDAMLDIPVLAVAGEKGIGANHEALVRAFSTNLVENIIVPGAGHFAPEERPGELTMALNTFLER